MHDPDLVSFGGGTGACAQELACIECGRVWRDPGERWRVYVLDEDPPEAVPYCDACAAREFG